jgi:hypothetical protein
MGTSHVSGYVSFISFFHLFETHARYNLRGTEGKEMEAFAEVRLGRV